MSIKSNITIQDIATIAGVSKTTVSRFINGKYEYMSDSTRKRIEQIITDVNFRPNKLAGSLKTSKSDLIGLILPNAVSTMTPYLIGSICDYSTMRGRKVIVVTSNGNVDRERELANNLIDQQVDGLIVATGCNQNLYKKIDDENAPVVLIDRMPPEILLDSVAINHYKSTTFAINHLLKQGYQKIVIIMRSNRNRIGTISIREQAALDACKFYFGNEKHSEKILIDENTLDISDPKQNEIIQCLQRLYTESSCTPTAIFLADGIIFGHFILGFYQLGLTSSPRFAISGYDTSFEGLLSKSFITIKQPLEQMGTIATELLIKRIDKKNGSSKKIHRYLDCKINIPQEI